MQIIEIRELIRELGKDHTVIFSSHILSEVQTICDEIIIINKGRLVAFDRPEDLKRHLLQKAEIAIVTDAAIADVEKMLEGIDGINEITAEKGDPIKVIIRSDIDDIYILSEAIYNSFKKTDHILYEMKVKKASLEDVFLELTDHKEAII